MISKLKIAFKIWVLIATLILPQINPKAQNVLNSSNRGFFIENKGQWSAEVIYLAQIGGMNAWITKTGVIYDYYNIERTYDQIKTSQIIPGEKQLYGSENTIKGHVVKMELIEVNINSITERSNSVEGYFNYFVGNDRSKWASNVRLYENIEHKGIYEGIDVRYYFDNGLLRYDYLAKPGADICQIIIKVEGQDGLKVNEKGELIIKTSLGEITHGKLYAYQQEKDGKKEVSCRFEKRIDDEIGIRVDNYDPNIALIIDPLVYSTFLGGSSDDLPWSIITDNDGNVFITGKTTSANFPATAGAYQTTHGGLDDAFVTKLNSNGSALIYSTFLGGYSWDEGRSLTLDANGSVFVTGFTYSNTFPITPGAFQTTFGGIQDGFITKLNAGGNAITYSTFLGGQWGDIGYYLTTDNDKNLFVTGYTESLNFPITPGAFQTVKSLNKDGFVAKLDSTLSSLHYSTFLGGNGDDYGYSLSIRSDGSAYIGGQTSSTDFPVSPAAFQDTLGQTWIADAFITNLDPLGSSINYSTYLGGDGWDYANSLTSDNYGNVYITGQTASSNFPVTPGAFQLTPGGDPYIADAFVTKLNNLGSALIYSTYLGGQGDDLGRSIVLASDGSIILTGWTNSDNFPSTPDAYQPSNGGTQDVFVTKVNLDGSALDYSTYLGGSNLDYGFYLATDTDGNVSVTGWTQSTNFPTSSGAYQTAYGGGDYDAFVTKFLVDLIPVELTSFYANVSEDKVNLNWSTSTETNNSGFNIERSSGSEFQVIGFAAGHGTTTEIQSYTFTDDNVSNGKYSYRLKQIDLDGTFEYSKTIEVEVTTPLEFSLAQNYPNPFNPSTTIKYNIPSEGTGLALSAVTLKVYDVLGKEVATLVNEEKPAGNFEIEFDATHLSSGVYYYQLRTGEFVETKKMILLR